MSCRFKNLATTSPPKVNETPRSFSPQPCTSLSGSDQSRSHRSPVSGTSVGLMIRRICSIDCRSGDRPPWQQNIFSSIIAAMGRQLKQSVKVFHNLILNLRLPTQHWQSIKIELYVFLNSIELTFIVEAIDPVNTGTLVVASQEKKVFGIFDFVGEQ